MAGIDNLATVMGRDHDLDAVERDNLCDAAANRIKRLEDKLHAIYLELSQRAPQTSPGVERAIEITQED